MLAERTSSDWFQEAARCYVEKHQGCPWCGGSHRVFRTCQGDSVAYYCNSCDFQAVHDKLTGQYRWIRGQDITKRPPTMYEI